MLKGIEMYEDVLEKGFKISWNSSLFSPPLSLVTSSELHIRYSSGNISHKVDIFHIFGLTMPEEVLQPPFILNKALLTTWNSKQPVLNGCLLKQPFPM